MQRDLLPLIEGTTVNTKHGPVKTDHMLFICSGAFHLAKPSDLLPELQGRLPIRVEPGVAQPGGFPPHPDRARGEPGQAVQGAAGDREGRARVQADDAIDELAKLSAEINEAVENIGARRLHTVMEKLLEEISFTASDSPGRKVEIDAAYVREKVGELAKNADLSKFVLLSRSRPLAER